MYFLTIDGILDCTVGQVAFQTGSTETGLEFNDLQKFVLIFKNVILDSNLGYTMFKVDYPSERIYYNEHWRNRYKIFMGKYYILKKPTAKDLPYIRRIEEDIGKTAMDSVFLQYWDYIKSKYKLE